MSCSQQSRGWSTMWRGMHANEISVFIDLSEDYLEMYNKNVKRDITQLVCFWCLSMPPPCTLSPIFESTTCWWRFLIDCSVFDRQHNFIVRRYADLFYCVSSIEILRSWTPDTSRYKPVWNLLSRSGLGFGRKVLSSHVFSINLSFMISTELQYWVWKDCLFGYKLSFVKDCSYLNEQFFSKKTARFRRAVFPNSVLKLNHRWATFTHRWWNTSAKKFSQKKHFKRLLFKTGTQYFGVILVV